MSKTVDDLIAVFEKARAEAAPFPQHHEDGLYAGIAAVIRALRDDFIPKCWKLAHLHVLSESDLKQLFNDILGSDAGEKVAGVERVVMPTSAVAQAETPATAPAPDVCTSCYGTGEDTVMERRCHCQPPDTTTTRCPDCNGEGCTPQTDRRGNVYAEPCPRCETTGRVPATEPAPAVCEWTKRKYEPGFYATPHGIKFKDRRYDNCGICGREIKFTEAKT